MYTALSMETGMALDYERTGHYLTTKRPIVRLAKLARRFGHADSVNR